ncbi:hypothetical protein EVAR_56604_1 [Eumeta japonica]|uniref:Uncharacterized protein n=1 Tax=Eumeta variegata TaxID=151549 RepID=A0A4C1YXE8_EUMVA|nr:hypothetical protein EVAR_56604_1 [Eumeta japonica]
MNSAKAQVEKEKCTIVCRHELVQKKVLTSSITDVPSDNDGDDAATKAPGPRHGPMTPRHVTARGVIALLPAEGDQRPLNLRAAWRVPAKLLSKITLVFELLLAMKHQDKQLLITSFQNSSAVVSISVTNFVMVARPPL